MQRVVLLAIMRAQRLTLSREAVRELVYCLPPRTAASTLAEVLGEEWVQRMARVLGIVLAPRCAGRACVDGVVFLDGGEALRRALTAGRAVVAETADARVFALAGDEAGVAVVDDAEERILAPDKAHALLTRDAVGFLLSVN